MNEIAETNLLSHQPTGSLRRHRSRADYRKILLAGGIPAYFADAMDELFSERRHGQRRIQRRPQHAMGCSG